MFDYNVAKNHNNISIVKNYVCIHNFLYSVPSTPRQLRITRGIENGVELNWLPPVNPNGVITYEIEYTTNSTFTIIGGTVLTQNNLTHYNWTGPEFEFPTYFMRVRAVNSANTDTGTMSEPSNVLEQCLGTERGTYKYLLMYTL